MAKSYELIFQKRKEFDTHRQSFDKPDYAYKRNYYKICKYICSFRNPHT